MTAPKAFGADASFTSAPLDWKTIDWPSLRQKVRRLQMRIAKAVKTGRHRSVKALQWMLTHSRSARLLAVRRVTTNAGAKTPGVDNQRWRTDKQKLHQALNLKRHGYKALPLRRHLRPQEERQDAPAEHSDGGFILHLMQFRLGLPGFLIWRSVWS